MAFPKINGVVLVVVVLAMVSVMARQGEAAIQCPQVNAAFQPCMAYLESGGEPGETCCDGLRNIKGQLPTTADRRAACACIKAAASKLPASIDGNAASLPDKCDTPISFPISRSVDCNSVN